MNRIIWIDIAKAICIVLVVIGHYIPDTHPLWYWDMRQVIYSFHMPLFMFASGFVYIATKRETSYTDFICRKVKRLMVPYLTVSVLVITIKLCTQGQAYVENPVTLMSYLKLFYLPEAGYFLWFVWALWWMFVVIPLFKTPLSRLALLMVSAFLPIIAPYMPEEFCLKQFCQMLQYFCIGVVAYDWRQYFLWSRHVPVLAVGTAFCLIKAWPYLNLGGGNSFLTALVGISFVLRISYGMENRVKSSSWGKAIMTISSASYIIYLLHTTFEGFMKAFVFKMPYISNLSDNLAFTIGAIMVIISGVVCPVILYKYLLEKYSLTKFLFGLK